MDEQGDIHNKSTVANVQLHEIKPVAEGMSFGALLDKFYLSIDAGSCTAETIDEDTNNLAKAFINISSNTIVK